LDFPYGGRDFKNNEDMERDKPAPVRIVAQTYTKTGRKQIKGLTTILINWSLHSFLMNNPKLRMKTCTLEIFPQPSTCEGPCLAAIRKYYSVSPETYQKNWKPYPHHVRQIMVR